MRFDEEDALEESGQRAQEFAAGTSADDVRAAVGATVAVAKEVLGGFSPDEDEEKPPHPTLRSASPALVEADASEPEEFASFILATSGRGTRLHKALGCWHSRTLAFHRYELVDGDMPDPEKYTAICRKCWPQECVEGGVASDSSSASSSSASSARDESDRKESASEVAAVG